MWNSFDQRLNTVFGMPTLLEIDSLEETIKLCRQLGLCFVELNMNLPQYQIKELEKTKKLNELKDKYDVFYTIHLDENLNISDFNHLVADAYMKTVKRTVLAAKKLAVPIINMHMNHGVHFTLPDQKVQLFNKYKEAYLDSMKRFGEMCMNTIGESELLISIENTDGFKEYEKEAVELLLNYNCFVLTWDIGHSHTCDNLDESFILKHEDKLKHFHIHDARQKENHLTLGTGEIDLVQRLEAAEKNHCRCVIETKTVKALEESVAWLMKNQ